MEAKQQTIPKGGGATETKKHLVLDFDPATTKDGVELDVCYFGPGIRWIPTYRVALAKGGTASLTMQAELLNESEHLDGVPVDLVVGVPNFRFRNCVSPICLAPSLVNPLQRAAPQIMGQSASNVLFSQRGGESRGRRIAPQPAAAGGAPAIPAELAAEGAHDLFVYHLPKLALRAGERAAIPVLQAKVPCRHLYTWDVHLAHAGTEALPNVSKHASPVRLLKNEIWHQVELSNDTNVPWTTGAALVVDGYLPIGQELLTYTSIGAKVQVPITVAIDVRGTYAEKELARVLKAIRYRGYDHAKISKQGTLRVTNYKRSPSPSTSPASWAATPSRLPTTARSPSPTSAAPTGRTSAASPACAATAPSAGSSSSSPPRPRRSPASTNTTSACELAACAPRRPAATDLRGTDPWVA